MYTLQSSLCLGRTIGAQWETPDLSGVFMYSVLSTYKKIFLVVTHPSQVDPLYVDLNELRVELSSYTGSVDQWLDEIGDAALPFVPELPNGELRYAKYGNAIQSGYRFNVVQAGFNYPQDTSNQAFTDLKVTREHFETDMRLLDSHCLMTVNGLIHATVANASEAFILGGATTARMSRDPHVGIWSFLDISPLTKVRFTNEQLTPFDDNGTLYEKMRITVPEGTENQSFFLVLGGIPVFPSAEVLYQVGERSFALDLKRIPYEDRVMYTRKLMNLNSLELSPIDDAPNHVSLEEIRSDAVIRKYFQLSQSFMVFVNVPQLFVSKIPVLRAAFPGQFLHHDDPVYPLSGTLGKFFEYWKIEEPKCWTLNMRDTFSQRFAFREEPPHPNINVSNAQDPTRDFDHAYGYLLEVSGTPSV